MIFLNTLYCTISHLVILTLTMPCDSQFPTRHIAGDQKLPANERRLDSDKEIEAHPHACHVVRQVRDLLFVVFM